jgi:hypothetical protein
MLSHKYVSDEEEIMFVCHECDAYYFINQTDGKLTSYNFPYQINGKPLCIYFHDDQTFEIEGNATTILKLDYWPNLTAQNIESKLKTWMIFS